MLFNDITIARGNKQKIALRLESLTQKGIIPLDEALALGNGSSALMRQLKLQLKINLKTIDIVEFGGQLFFRLEPNDLGKLFDFLKLSVTQKRLKITQATRQLRLSKARYNPATQMQKDLTSPKAKWISARFFWNALSL